MRRGAALSLSLGLFACSCGLLSDDAASVPFPSDGVAPFRDARPIELCLGSARVVSPSAASGVSGAVCVAAGDVAAACGADSGCEGIERCICGRCIVRACQGASVCDAGEVCRGKRCTKGCSEDDECGAGQACVSGGCARTCGDSSECHYGERCDSLYDVCTTKTCGGGVACGAGDVCEAEEVLGDAREPEPLLTEGERAALFSLDGSIYRARVAGDTQWVTEPIEPVVAGDASGAVSAPSPIAGEGSIDLYFAVGEGEAIARAVSTDGGLSFVRDEAALLRPEAAWERGRVASPAAFVFRGETWIAYEGGDGEGIGLARVDGGSATRQGEAPIATAATFEDPLFFRGSRAVGAPFALVVGDVVRLYVTVRGAEGGDAITKDGPIAADVSDSIALLTSTDLVSFTPYPAGPVLARVANLRAYLGEREASVRLLDAGAEMLFVATDASGSVVNGLARAVAPGAAP